MAEYINREAAKDAVCTVIFHDGISDALKSCLDDIPAADVVPVRHGHLVNQTNPFTAKCSECGGPVNVRWKYCPNCGAKMDKDGDGE